MSEVAKKLEAVRGEDKRYWPGPFGVTIRQHYEKLESQHATAYEVRALFAARVFAREPNGITAEQVRDAKRHIIEEVFGEFRRPLMQIRVALHELDIEKARALVDALQVQMFEP